jgi:hypothetical protein
MEPWALFHSEASNETAGQALTAMAKRNPDRPMVMQPVRHDLTAPTQMLPIMPTAGSEAKVSVAKKKQPSRTEAVQAAKAKITRRNSLRKQRDAQARKE